MKGIDSYNWEDLYNKANEFINTYIPVATVNTGCKSFIGGVPRVQISFIAKGNRQYIKLLDEMKCMRKLKGMNGKDGRIIQAEIIFNVDGSIN